MSRNDITPSFSRLKFVTLLLKTMQNFQSIIILRRRKQQQRLRNKRAELKKFCLLTFLELEARLLEMAPLIAINGIWQNKLHSTPDKAFNNNPNNDSDMAMTTVKLLRNPRRNVRFYEDIVSTYNDEKFLQTFRMSRRNFNLLCDQLRDTLQPNAPVKNLISLETRCALSLYAFAAGDDYRVVASIFGISRASVCKFTKKFAEALLEKLGPHLLALPRNEEEYREIRMNFQRVSGLPALCVGLLGAFEINVSPQLELCSQYANVAGVTTLILQALVDDKMLFRKVQIEAQRPTLLLTAPNEITKLGVRKYKERFLPCFVIAPANYYEPQPWLLQPFANPKDAHEIRFNKAIEMLQSIKRNAFHRLFSRWKILQRKGDLDPKTMSLIAHSCCALHNLLQECEESFDDNWSEGVDLTHFDELTHCKEIVSISKQSETTRIQALSIRNFLADDIYESKM